MTKEQNDIIQRMNTERKRPTLNDPKEFAIIRSVYFQKDSPLDKNEISESIERSEIKKKILNNTSR
jgi:hypothetical protein